MRAEGWKHLGNLIAALNLFSALPIKIYAEDTSRMHYERELQILQRNLINDQMTENAFSVERGRSRAEIIEEHFTDMFISIEKNIVLGYGTTILDVKSVYYTVPLPLIVRIRSSRENPGEATEELLYSPFETEERFPANKRVFFEHLGRICSKHLWLLVNPYARIDGMKDKVSNAIFRMRRELIEDNTFDKLIILPRGRFFCVAASKIILDSKYLASLSEYLKKEYSHYEKQLRSQLAGSAVRLSKDMGGDEFERHFLSAGIVEFYRGLYTKIERRQSAVTDYFLAGGFNLYLNMLLLSKTASASGQLHRDVLFVVETVYNVHNYYAVSISLWAMDIHYLLLSCGDSPGLSRRSANPEDATKEIREQEHLRDGCLQSTHDSSENAAHIWSSNNLAGNIIQGMTTFSIRSLIYAIYTKSRTSNPVSKAEQDELQSMLDKLNEFMRHDAAGEGHQHRYYTSPLPRLLPEDLRVPSETEEQS